MIVDKIRQWSKNKIQPTGLTMQTIIKVSNYFKENFGCTLPEGYINFLKIMAFHLTDIVFFVVIIVRLKQIFQGIQVWI